MSNFFYDRDTRGQPLELLIAEDLHNHGIPFGFNQYSGTEDPRREDFDIYVGQPEDPLLTEEKMDWSSGITGNIYVEEKALHNTKSQNIIYGRLLIDVFNTEKLREMYNQRNGKMYAYKHVITGGDQAKNPGMLLGWQDVKANSQPYWKWRNQLMKPI